MSRRSVFAAIALLALGVPALAQVSVTNANSFELDNGTEAFAIFPRPRPRRLEPRSPATESSTGAPTTR